MKDISKPVNIFIFCYITLFYTYFFHSDWRGIYFASLTENFDMEAKKEPESQKTEKYDIDSSVNLSNYAFIDSNLDTVNLLNSSGKYVLIETWNETCIPCIKAMKELPEFYNSIQNKVETYYLYENSKDHVRRKFDNIFNFKNIADKSKIIIDIDQNLYRDLNMQGFPYFLLFDSQGKLVYHSRGYIGKENLMKEIKESIR